MTSLKFLLPLIAIFLLMPDARAARGNRAGQVKPKATPEDPAADPGDPKKGTGQACGDKATPSPFIGKFSPRLPTSPALAADQKISADMLPALRFDEVCARVRDADGTPEQKANCDLTLAAILQFYRDEKDSLDTMRKDLCSKMEADAKACEGQADALKCSAAIYADTGKQFLELSKRLQDKAKILNQRQLDLHLKIAASELAAKDAAGEPVVPVMLRTRAETMEKLGIAGNIDDRTRQPMLCMRGVAPNGPFCAHALVAAEAKYFSTILEKTSEITGINGKSLTDLGTQIQTSADRQGPPDNPGNGNGNGNGPDSKNPNAKKSSGLLGGMGLDDMLKMATLGMTGASLYCTMTKSCGNGAATPPQSGISDASTNPGVTAPGGSGVSNGPQKSSTGDVAKNGNPPNPASDTKTETETGTSFHGSSGGYSSGSSEPALAHFNGSLDSHGPVAATGGPVGGGGSGGSGASGNQNAGDRAPASASGDGNKNSDNGSGTLGGGGGLSSSGSGFSLGDSHNATPADAALKDILNGDSPLGAGALPSLGENGEVGADLAAGSGLGMDDPESLFTRVRGTHVRCLKRGCVGREVGQNI